MKCLNQKPTKLTQLNDISRISEFYTAEGVKPHSMLAPLCRQLIMVAKFTGIDLQCLIGSQSFNRTGSVEMMPLEPCRAKALTKELGLQMTLKRVPKVETIADCDEARFALFTKSLWKGIYDVPADQAGYTVVLVPSYFDYIRLKNFFKRKNAQVAMISEYTDRK